MNQRQRELSNQELLQELEGLELDNVALQRELSTEISMLAELHLAVAQIQKRVTDTKERIDQRIIRIRSLINSRWTGREKRTQESPA